MNFCACFFCKPLDYCTLVYGGKIPGVTTAVETECGIFLLWLPPAEFTNYSMLGLGYYCRETTGLNNASQWLTRSD